MKTSFESIIEDVIPEINFLSASEKVEPGDVLESLEKDIVIGYLPTFLQENGIMKNNSFEQIEEPYDILLDEIDGSASHDSALKILSFLGLKAQKNIEYRIDFELTELSAIKFSENIDKINFEIALRQLRKVNRKLFRRFKGHFLVTKVLYAKAFKVEVEVKKNGEFEADVDVKSVDVEADIKFEKKENAIIVSNNSSVPVGVIGYKIKPKQLKEVD